MIRSHLLSAFLSSAWHLHGQVYDRLSDLLEAHVTGRKAELRARDVMPLDFMDDGADAAAPVDETAGDYLIDGIAVIDIRGVLAMHAADVNGDCQPQGRSYDSIIAQVELAAVDPNVKAVVVRLETPGGSACGCQEVYDAISAADIIKPYYAFINGYCFSAGTYISAACRTIIASSIAAHTGSIGTVMATWDTSAANEAAGYKRVVIRAGAYKALAQDGEPITDTALAEMQRECDAYGAAFHDAVRAGRGLTDAQAEQVLNGRTFLASEAQALGLIDGIQSFSSFLAAISAGTSETPMFSNKKPTAPLAIVSAEEIKPLVAATSDGLTKAQYAALSEQFPDALDRLKDLDAANKSAGEIEATLLREKVTALKGALDAANTAHTAFAAAHTAAISAKDATIADLQSKVQKAQQWTGVVAGVVDPGAKPDAGAAKSAATIQAAWDADPKLREQFALGGIGSYVEHLVLNNALTNSEGGAIRAQLAKAAATAAPAA